MCTCRSELARDGRKGDALNQIPRVIVDVHREQARSYTYKCQTGHQRSFFMRRLILLGLVCALSTPLAFARAIPDPNQHHAPGNESLQTPIAQAGLRQVPIQVTCEASVPGGQEVTDPPQQLHRKPSMEQ